jgi:transcriptional regulator with XRE-family HTH domain
MTTVQDAIADFFNVAKLHKIRACQIANEAGITRVTLSNWKTDRCEPTLSAWLMATDALERLVAQKLDA